jgi:hypothetical protein
LVHKSRDGFTFVAVAPSDPSEERSAKAVEREALADEIATSPALPYIATYLRHAEALGLEPSEPDTIRRAMTAGVRAYETEQARQTTLRSYARLRPGSSHAPVVYYIRAGSMVKIGTSTNLRRRMNALSTRTVIAVEPGDATVETERHEQFGALRRHGEWFEMDPALAAHIVGLRERFEAETGYSVERWAASLPDPREAGRPVLTETVDLGALPVRCPVPGQLELTAAVCRTTGVNRSTVNTWRRNGRLAPVAATASGRPLFNPADVITTRDTEKI